MIGDLTGKLFFAQALAGKILFYAAGVIVVKVYGASAFCEPVLMSRVVQYLVVDFVFGQVGFDAPFA